MNTEQSIILKSYVCVWDKIPRCSTFPSELISNVFLAGQYLVAGYHMAQQTGGEEGGEEPRARGEEGEERNSEEE